MIRLRGAEASGAALIALASGQFGAVTVLGKIATDRGAAVPPMLAVRFGVAAAVLTIPLALMRRPLRAAPGEKGRLFVLGAAGYAGEAALFFLAVERGTASAVTLLFFTYPVVVTIAMAALGRGRPTAGVLGALVAAVGGAALVVGSAGGLDISATGIAFALGSATAYALYLTGADLAVRETAPLTGALWLAASASLALAVVSVVLRAGLPIGTVGIVAAMGVFTAGAFVSLLAGLRRLGAVRAAIVAALEPLATAALAVAFLGEALRGGTVAGGVLILAGAVAATAMRGRRAARVPPEVP